METTMLKKTLHLLLAATVAIPMGDTTEGSQGNFVG